MPTGAPCNLHPDQPLIGACDRCGDFGCRLCLPNGRSCVRCAPQGAAAKPDLGASIGFVFKDPRWFSKLAVAAGWMLLSLVGMLFFIIPFFFIFGIVVGYALRVARNEREGRSVGLPEWNGLGALSWDGFKGYLCTALPTFALYGFLVAGVGGLAAVAALTAGPKPGPDPPVWFIVAIVFFVLAFYGAVFAVMLATPAILVVYLRTGSVLAAFHLRTVWRTIADRPLDYLVLVVFGLIVYFIAAFAGELMCLVGLFFTLPWALVTFAHYLGRYCAWAESNPG